MFNSRIFQALILVTLMLVAAPAQARDWFVKAGGAGDGSKEKPFGDPFEALEKCEANDVIHITEGRYTGKLQNGEWIIPFEGVQLVGGYNADFTQRDPWQFKTMLVWDRNSKNKPDNERIVATVGKVVLDGLVIDGREQNEYNDTGREQRSLDKGDAAVHLWLPSTVRNCVFLNTGRQAVVASNGSTLENNLFMNTFDSAVKINGLPPASDQAKTPAIIKNNTFLWAWDDRSAGQGGYQGAGVYFTGPVNISNNIFAHCDNNAIYGTIAADRSSITNNVFFMNLWSNVKMHVGDHEALADDKSMDTIEEIGLKAFDGNQVLNPGMPLDPKWMDATMKRTSLDKGKVEMNDMNNLRQALGLDLQGTGGAPASGIAPAYPIEKVMALMAPKNAAVKAGARIIKLETHFAGPTVAAAEKAYQKAELISWAHSPDTVDGKPLEMVVAISNVANINGIPAPYKVDDYQGIRLHDANGTENITGFYKKGSAVQRLVEAESGNYNGSGKADRLFVVKGTAYVVQNLPKAGFLIDSIVPLEIGSLARAKPKGQDWFVRAGATGGDGSKDKPFRDPYQALEKVEAGDTIHVAGGEYVGKLRAGKWKIDSPDITLLGGYDKDFATRDPWKNITLLYCPADYKGSRIGYTLEGTDDHTGAIVDGFVFDKKLDNKYADSGDLLQEESDKSQHIWLSKPGCIVRNCVFINGAEGAARLGTAETVENCIFFNHAQWVVRVERTFTPEVPFVFRNNTVAFAWEKRFGQGHGIMADLLILENGVRAVVDNNIFEFADQHALRINNDPKDIELTNNMFAQNLFAEVYRTQGDFFIDNKNFGDLRQLGWKKLENNVLQTPGLPIDEKWFNTYLTRTAYVPGKVEMDDWNQLREIMGQPMIATGGKAGDGFAPAYDRALAVQLFPKNPAIKAGAHPVKLDVKFEGIARPQNNQEYTDTTWDVAKSGGDWDKLDGKRVALKVAIKSGDNQWMLPDIKEAQYSSWTVGGPEGTESGGLPMHVYVPVGTKVERVFKQAKGYSNGAIEETHIIKGIVRAPRQLVVEAAERAD